MKKIFFLVSMSVCIFLSLGSSNVFANNLIQDAKIWTITMNENILNTVENLSYVQVINEDGELVPSSIEIQDNFKTLEVIPYETYAYGNYKVIINKGFQSASGGVLENNYNYNFKVGKSIRQTELLGIWSTTYTYEGDYFDIEAEFKESHANVYLKLAGGLRFHALNQLYSIEDNQMNMKVEEGNKKFDLSGKIRVYNSNKFKVITQSGKFAIFERIQ